MPYGFEPGRIYNRRSDIHARFGGQQQGGIITPAQHSLLIIITGEEGLEHGYADRYRADGVFEYFGEGQVGHMRLRAGNRAIAEHSSLGKDLLLFRKTAEGLRFQGEMVCEGYHVERAPDRTGAGRDAIVFELRALEAIVEKVEAEPAPSGATLGELRQLALTAANNTSQAPSQGKRNVYQRSRDVRNYVLARAKGKCEGCGTAAPFFRQDGTPYLEPHHLRACGMWLNVVQSWKNIKLRYSALANMPVGRRLMPARPGPPASSSRWFRSDGQRIARLLDAVKY